MSMDDKGIKEIASMAKTGAKVETGGMDAVLVPNDFDVQSLEKLQKGRFRFRGAMETDSILDFIEYTNRFDTAECFIDSESMRAKSFFNLGTLGDAGHGDHHASLQLRKMAAYSALCRIDTSPMNQQQAIEWVEDWQDFLVGINSVGEPIPIDKAIASIRTIKIKETSEQGHTRESMSETKSAMDTIEAKSKDGDLPVAFVMTCQPYNGLEDRDFSANLSIRTGGHAPNLVLRVAQHEAIKEEMAVEFKGLLKKDLESEKITIGSFALLK